MIELLASGLSVAAMWALGPLLQKIVLGRGVSSVTIIAVSGIFTLSFGSIFLFAKRHDIYKDLGKLDLEILGLIAFAGIVCGLLANYIFLGMLSKYDAYLVNAIAYSSPVFTLVFAMWLLGESISMVSILGFVLLTSGLVLITMGVVPGTPHNA